VEVATAAGGNNYDGPGTGSYLGRRVQATTPAIPKEDFDIQSSNARFDKDQFKEQLKVAAQKAKVMNRPKLKPHNRRLPHNKSNPLNLMSS